MRYSKQSPVSLYACFLFVVLSWALLPLAIGEVVLVPQDIPSINDAIRLAHDGDEIIVSPGVYKEQIGINKSVNIHSTDPTDWSIVETTVIDGEGNGSGLPLVSINNDSRMHIRLAGFTIRNSSSSGVFGGGADTVIEYCHVMDNNGTRPFVHSLSQIRFGKASRVEQGPPVDDRQYGGGIFGNNGTIQNCIIERNYAEMGGGMAMCHGTIQNNIIVRNRLVDWGQRGAAGGAMYNCGGKLRNNTIVDNAIGKRGKPGEPYQWRGGGLVNCFGTHSNNIIWITREDLTPEYENCPIPSFSCIKNWKGGGDGNISQSPRFRNAVFDDVPGSSRQGHVWAKQDFSLLPDSPCIDSGRQDLAPNKDFHGKSRTQKGAQGKEKASTNRVDMGAIEYFPDTH